MTISLAMAGTICIHWGKRIDYMAVGTASYTHGLIKTIFILMQLTALGNMTELKDA